MGGSWRGAVGNPPSDKLQHIQFSWDKAGWKDGGALQPAVGGEARTNRVFAFAKKEDEEGNCINLPMLFLAGLREFSSFDLYKYYSSLELIAVKRPHPKSRGSKQSRAAKRKSH